MFIYPVYNKIKERLSGLEIPTFFYIGQYQAGKNNISYLVPAIYIEMPKDVAVKVTNHITRSQASQVKIHYISYAPFKNATTDIQESAIAEHEQTLRAIDLLLHEWNATDEGVNLTEQFIAGETNTLMQFKGMTLFSVLGYSTRFKSRHLKDTVPHVPSTSGTIQLPRP